VFQPAHVEQLRQKYPGIKILVHPECQMDVVHRADAVGSTEKIIRLVEEAPAGTCWAIGTELHLVNRLKHQHPEQQIHFLSPIVCMCATMYRIDLAHLCWTLENLAAGTPVGVIRVDDETARLAAESLQRMLEALERVHIEGVETNLAFLRRALAHPEFRSGRVRTDFIDAHRAELV
jgi:quinolinate synthase